MSTLINQCFIVSSDVLFQEVSGEVVLLDLASEEYFGLDKIGTRIWQSIHSGTELSEALDQIVQDYNVSRSQLETDVERLLGQLIQAGLLTPEKTTGTE